MDLGSGSFRHVYCLRTINELSLQCNWFWIFSLKRTFLSSALSLPIFVRSFRPYRTHGLISLLIIQQIPTVVSHVVQLIFHIFDKQLLALVKQCVLYTKHKNHTYVTSNVHVKDNYPDVILCICLWLCASVYVWVCVN